MKKNKKKGTAKSRTAKRRKPGGASKLLLAIVTCINLILTLVLAVLRRQSVLRAVRDDEKLKLLLEQPVPPSKSK